MAPRPGGPGRVALALLLLLLTLPGRLRQSWGIEHPWQTLGVVLPASAGCAPAGLSKAVALWRGGCPSAQWPKPLARQITTGEILNAIALLLGVGFAEELLFRGWLWGELELLWGRQRAIGLQAAFFALVHPWYQLPGFEAIGLLVGLVLLGVALALQRRADHDALWGSVGLHGGLVGGWFALQAGLISVPEAGPAWLLGPGGASPNPIGGLLGWAGLAGLILVRRRWWR